MSAPPPPRGRGRGRGKPSTSEDPSVSRPVGGLLAMERDTKPVLPATTAGAGARGGMKFKPNMVRKKPVVRDSDDEDDDDVKVEDTPYASSSRGRGRGAATRGRGRGRVEVEMTASGPMAQGPSGAPRVTGRPIQGGAGAMLAATRVGQPGQSGSGSGGGGGGGGGGGSGSGAASSSRPRRANTQADDQGQFSDPDPDDSDLENEDGEAYLLDNIGLEDEMAPMNLPKDPKVLREAEARKKERMILRLKEEEKKRKREEKDKAEADGTPFVKGEPNEDSESVYMSSHQGTPAPAESVAETFDSKDALGGEPEEEEKKDFKFEEKVNLADDFDIKENRDQDRMYMFQFPRTFPHLVREEDAAALRPQYSADGTEIKPEPVEGGVPRGGKNPKNLVPPPWGTAGPRENMAARWPTAEGQMGELCIHKSGKVTMKVFGDLDFDVLPAAQATFLQEIAILDHDPALVPLQPGQTEADRPPSNPDRKLKIMGQTYKKFIVAPEVSHLLEKIAEQEKEEAELAAKRRLLKKEKK